MKEFLRQLPVPLLPTMTGVLTLANVYGGLGYTWLRHLCMWLCASLLLLYLAKMIMYPQQIKDEYNQVIMSSLYAGLAMTTMILGNYLTDYWLLGGQILWLIATLGHIIHIIVFTFKHARIHFRKTNFVPAWFVTYNALTTSVVVGGPMGFTWLQQGIAIYCVAIYLFLIPFMIYRLIRLPIPKALYHTQAILLAPISLSVAGVLTVFSRPPLILMVFLYTLLILTLVFVVIKLPSFLAFDFTPGFAGLTFPMAVGVVATTKMSVYLTELGYLQWGEWLHQLQGIQLYLTTVVVGYVFLRLLGLIVGIDRKIRLRYE